MAARTLALLVVLAAVLAGCSNSQDVGDANKNPEPGKAGRPGAPGGGGAPEPKMATPQ